MLNSKKTRSDCAKTPDPSISSGLYVKNQTIRVLLDSGSSGDLLFMKKGSSKCISVVKRVVPQLWGTSNSAMNQQQTKIIANLIEAIAKLKAGSPPTKQQSGCANPFHWRATKPAWDQMGYCWTHGFRVKVGHSSATCSFPKEGHCADATCTNTKGGSNLRQGGPKPPT